MQRVLYALVGGLALTAGLVTAFLIAVVGGLECSGTDAGEPSDSALCDGSRPDAIFIGVLVGMVAAPLVGTGISLATGEKRGVTIGCSVAAATLAAFVILVRTYS